MEKCPECNGKRIKISVYPEMGLGMKDTPKTLEKKCKLCNGKGVVDKLTLGVYKARGGLPAVKERGYS